MTINYVTGDLFTHISNSGTQIIPHICNNIGGWGAGFVLPLGRTFPVAETSYYRWCKDKWWKDCLGEHRFKLGETQIIDCGNNTFVANMIAQYETISQNPNSTPIRYSALAQCLFAVKSLVLLWEDFHSTPIEIHAPKFGSGLAGGNWDIIETLIKEVWIDHGIPVTIYEL